MISKFFQHIQSKINEDINVWVLAAFLPTFAIARFLVYNFPGLFLNLSGTHVHHFTYGIILLAVSGILALNETEQKTRNTIAVLYGMGLALAFDEFGMWLHLSDAYWVRQSYDAVVIVAAILVSIIYFSYFWSKLFKFKSK
jgi:uncharacterized membrane protein YadS